MGKISMSQLDYNVSIVTEGGDRMDVTNAVTDLSWEEMENEMAGKITFKLFNIRVNGTLLTKLVKLGQMVEVTSDWGGGTEKVTGIIFDWDRTSTADAAIFTLTCYDQLYYLQRSQDIFLYENATTEEIITDVCENWGVPCVYNGPSVTHEKYLQKKQNIADFVKKVLNDCRKLSGQRAVIHYKDGAMHVDGVGTNSEVWEITYAQQITARHKYSMADMVTQVQVVSFEDKSGLPELVATMVGNTSYGCFQRIVTFTNSENYGDAMSEAAEMIAENGKPKETCTGQFPDIPPLHKGHKLHVDCGALHGDFIVLSVQHICAKKRMNVTLEKMSR